MSCNIFMRLAFPGRRVNSYEHFVINVNRHMDLAFKKMKAGKYSLSRCYYNDCIRLLETYINSDICNKKQAEELSKILSRARDLHKEAGLYLRGQL
ncbi:TPA: hypothetical protein U0R95_004706 [Escherichia coli]|nr:hypothetical protein [Escherichia coli]HEM0002298.1 hypothetical protein [Escherichia coli]